MTYLERIQAAKAKYKSCIPKQITHCAQCLCDTTNPDIARHMAGCMSEEIVIGYPPKQTEIYHILNCKLVQPSRCTYFVPIQKSEFKNPSPYPTHFIKLSECGKPMQTTRHKIEFYLIPPHTKIVSDITETPPQISGYTRPFLFHSTQQATDEIRHFLNTQI